MDDYTRNPGRHDFEPNYPGGDRCRWCMFHKGAHRAKGDSMAQQSNISMSDIHNRFGYHQATDKTGPQHAAVRDLFIQLANSLNFILPDGRAKSVAFTELENASMWANKAVAEQAPVVLEQSTPASPKATTDA